MFDYTLKILGSKIHELRLIKDDISRIEELQKAIEILRDGQGFLTNKEPKKIIFFEDI
jgi:hypothetical protein